MLHFKPVHYRLAVWYLSENPNNTSTITRHGGMRVDPEEINRPFHPLVGKCVQWQYGEQVCLARIKAYHPATAPLSFTAEVECFGIKSDVPCHLTASSNEGGAIIEFEEEMLGCVPGMGLDYKVVADPMMAMLGKIIAYEIEDTPCKAQIVEVQEGEWPYVMKYLEPPDLAGDIDECKLDLDELLYHDECGNESAYIITEASPEDAPVALEPGLSIEYEANGATMTAVVAEIDEDRELPHFLKYLRPDGQADEWVCLDVQKLTLMDDWGNTNTPFKFIDDRFLGKVVSFRVEGVVCHAKVIELRYGEKLEHLVAYLCPPDRPREWLHLDPEAMCFKDSEGHEGSMDVDAEPRLPWEEEFECAAFHLREAFELGQTDECPTNPVGGTAQLLATHLVQAVQSYKRRALAVCDLSLRFIEAVFPELRCEQVAAGAGHIPHDFLADIPVSPQAQSPSTALRLSTDLASDLERLKAEQSEVRSASSRQSAQGQGSTAPAPPPSEAQPPPVPPAPEAPLATTPPPAPPSSSTHGGARSVKSPTHGGARSVKSPTHGGARSVKSPTHGGARSIKSYIELKHFMEDKGFGTTQLNYCPGKEELLLLLQRERPELL